MVSEYQILSHYHRPIFCDIIYRIHGAPELAVEIYETAHVEPESPGAPP